MADKKSCEGRALNTYKCKRCNQLITLEGTIPKGAVHSSECDGEFIKMEAPQPSPDWIPPPPRKTRSAGTLTIDVDVSDALKGLKAVQREAKKATAALKKLEEQQKVFSVLDIPAELLGDTSCDKKLEEQFKAFKKNFINEESE